MSYYLLGKVLSHSFSPEIHALLGNPDYETMELAENDFGEFVKSKAFLGLNVTIPYKKAIYPYLDSVDDEAKETGSINTVVNKDGVLYGYNTDIFGFSEMLKYYGISLKNKVVAILGTGGASKSCWYVARKQNAKEILFVSHSHAEGALSYEELNKMADKIEVIINATPVGMYPNGGNAPLSLEGFSNLESVVDLVYNPLKTELVIEAESRHIKACAGLYMLVSQGAKSSEYFGIGTYNAKEVEEIYQKILSLKSNIALTGMPTAGKTMVGKELARLLNRDFVDTDLVIDALYGKSPKKIIEEEGIERFRAYESDVMTSLSQSVGLVISLGGGALLDENNLRAIKKNSIVYYLKRPIKELHPDSEHPLSDTKEKMSALYEARQMHYLSVADKIVDFEKVSFTDVAKQIAEEFEL